MTRREALILLGLHEDANRSQIQEAYSRRSKKYHSKDYDDEPEYAKKKLLLLMEARNIALGNSSPSSKGISHKARFTSRHIASDYDDFNECTFDSDAKHSSKRHTGEKIYNRAERRDRNRAESRDRNRDRNHSFSSKKKSSKMTLSQHLDKLKKEISDYQAEDAEMINEDYNLYDNLEESVASDNVTIGNVSTGNVKKKADTKSIISVLSFAILVFSILTTMCSTFDIDYDDSYNEDEYYEDHITRIADELNDEYQYLFDESPNTDIVEESYFTEDIIDAGDRFTYEYTDGIYYDLDQWIVDLQWAYPEEFQGEYIDTESALHDIFKFYGFPEYAYFLGEVNYYTDEQILSFLDYVNFLIDYYY